MPIRKVTNLTKRKFITPKWYGTENPEGRTKASRLGYYQHRRYRKIRNAKVEMENFECAACRCDGNVIIYGSEQLHVDHIEPIPADIDSFDQFLDLSSFDNLQVLCERHHREKTNRKGYFTSKYPLLVIKNKEG